MNHFNQPSSLVTAPTSTDSLEDSLAALKSSIEHLVHDGGADVGEVTQRAVSAKNAAVATGENFLATLKARIVARPFAAVAIAFGVGYIGMRIFR